MLSILLDFPKLMLRFLEFTNLQNMGFPQVMLTHIISANTVKVKENPLVKVSLFQITIPYHQKEPVMLLSLRVWGLHTQITRRQDKNMLVYLLRIPLLWTLIFVVCRS
uniref:Uncharacterized protein n=1 Tax=Opuntia streptacantha TaxID=393608 RepID=A0A7C9EKF7_OPUST